MAFRFSLGWVALLPVGFLACAGDKAEVPTAEKAAALEMQVGAATRVEQMLGPDIVGNFAIDASLACGSLLCLSAFEQTIHPSGPTRVLGTRIFKAGVGDLAVDMPRIVFPTDDDEMRGVAAVADRFVVLWEGGSSVVDAVTGEITGALEEGPTGYSPILMGGPHGFVVASTVDDETVVEVYDLNLEKVGEPVGLGPGSSEYRDQLGLAAGPDSYLVAAPGFAWRVNATDGTLQGAGAIEYSRYKKGIPVVAYGSGNFNIAWASDQTSIYTSRIRAADGEVLDPDDHFNLVSGAHLVCQSCTTYLDGLRTIDLVDLAGQLTLLWTRTDGETGIFAARIDPASGLRLDGETTGAETEMGPIDSIKFRAAVHGDVLIVQGQRQIRSYEVLDEVDTVEDYVKDNGERKHPAVAYNGSVFAAAWVDEYRISVGRFDAETGAALEATPFHLGNGSDVGIVAFGDDFLLAWIQEDQLRLRILGGDGTLGADNIAPIDGLSGAGAQTTDLTNLQLVSNNDIAFLSWMQRDFGSQTPIGILGVRVDSSGAPMGTPSTVGSGYLYSTTADHLVAAGQRSFLVATSTNSGDVALRFMRASTGNLVGNSGPAATLTGCREPLAASDGTALVVIARCNGGSEDEVARFIDPLDGSTVGEPVTLLAELGATHWVKDFFYDGAGYVLIAEYNDSSGTSLRTRRFDEDLQPLDANVPAPGTEVVPSFYGGAVASASDGAGRTFFVYRELDVAHLGVGLRSRLLLNDGEPTPATGTGGNPGAGGGAASGGSNSSSGGNGAATGDDGSSGGGAPVPSDDGSSADDGGSADDSGGSDGGATGGGCSVGHRASWDGGWLLVLGLVAAARVSRGSRIRVC